MRKLNAKVAWSGRIVAACLIGTVVINIGQAVAQVKGTWSDVIPLPDVPIAAALLSNGKILTWSSYGEFVFNGDIGNAPSQTRTTLFDPSIQKATLTVVTNIMSDMFCSGITALPDGQIMVNGGSSSPKSNIYNPGTNTWSTAANMRIPRGYNANVLLTDGSVLTLGGSWSGSLAEKIGEVWSANTGWNTRPNISSKPMTGPDPEDAGRDYIFRGDNHAWLFAVDDGLVFHAGPSAQMNWISTGGTGSITSAGTRAIDGYSMHGQAVMYDIGKILKAGGAPAYSGANATAITYVIDINGAVANRSNPVVRSTASMAYARAFASGVALPNGQVLMVGGQTYAQPFSDDMAVLVPELWDPARETFTQLAPMKTPRVYHSTALLMPDARIFVGGGGQCGTCSTNHPNAEIFSPPYLFNSDGSPAIRPRINSAPVVASLGATISVTTNSAQPMTFSLIRMSAVTHNVNNDQRRIPLAARSTSSGAYSLAIPASSGLVPRGYYMLFAINAQGTPSVARTVRVQ